eukprot:scaffold20893_cov94-Isochrysis_galbana.AAC.2
MKRGEVVPSNEERRSNGAALTSTTGGWAAAQKPCTLAAASLGLSEASRKRKTSPHLHARCGTKGLRRRRAHARQSATEPERPRPAGHRGTAVPRRRLAGASNRPAASESAVGIGGRNLGEGCEAEVAGVPAVVGAVASARRRVGDRVLEALATGAKEGVVGAGASQTPATTAGLGAGARGRHRAATAHAAAIGTAATARGRARTQPALALALDTHLDTPATAAHVPATARLHRSRSTAYAGGQGPGGKCSGLDDCAVLRAWGARGGPAVRAPAGRGWVRAGRCEYSRRLRRRGWLRICRRLRRLDRSPSDGWAGRAGQRGDPAEAPGGLTAQKG